MAVSFLDGKYVKQMTTSLQEIDETIKTWNFESSSGSGTEDTSALANNILLERNILTDALWSKNANEINRYDSSVFDISATENYVLWAIPSDETADVDFIITIYDSSNAVRYGTRIKMSNLSSIYRLSIPSAGAKCQFGVSSSNETQDMSGVVNTVFFGQVVADDALTEVEKGYLRDKLGLGDSDIVNDLANSAVLVTEQSLTTAQQEQARANIGLENISSLVEGTIKYSEDQSLTSEEQERARANLGLDNISSLVEGTVKYSEAQTLTEAEQEQARANIGLDDIGSLVEGTVKYSEAQALTTLQQDQARANIAAAKDSTVLDLNTTVSGLTTSLNALRDNVSDVTLADDGLTVHYANETTRGIKIAFGSELNSVAYDKNYYLHFYDKNGKELYDGPFFIQGGGGSGSTGGTATITRITDATVNCVYSQAMPIRFSFAATDSAGDVVGNGTGTWSVGGIVVVRNVAITQGQNSFDIGPYLSAGENAIRLSVSVDVGGEQNLIVNKTWTINAVNMRFIWSYNDAQVNTDSFLDSWTVYGDIQKTTHTLIDDSYELDTVVTTKSNSTQSISIPMLSHGAHSVERWLTADIGGTIQSTESQYHEMIFAVSGNSTPIIAISMRDISVNQYDTVRIPIMIYDPASLTATATLSIDGVEVDTWTVERTLQYWNYTPSESGEHTLTIQCGTAVKNVIVDVQKVSIDAEEVPGYSFRFKASDFASNEAVRNWTSNDVTASFSDNFDWINGGIHSEMVDEYNNEVNNNGFIQQYFCIKAGTRMTINHELFATDPKANGMNFKIIFKVKNCRDYDAEIGQCYSLLTEGETSEESNGVGIRLTAHKAFFESSGTSINVPYGEDEYIELEFDTYPTPKQENDGNVQYMMAWIDGVITSCRVYGSTDTFVQPEQLRKKIVLGSDDCDLYIYMVKAYPMLNKGSNFDNHISNFIMDAPNASEMLRRYNRNNILDESGEISYTKLVDANPDLRVWLYDIPYLTNGKKDKVSGCGFRQFWKNGKQYYYLEGVGVMTVQGTSSVKYIRGAANTDINFTELTDGNGIDLLANGVKDDAYGNNWFLEDSENPGHVKVFEVQNGEELGPECVAVERDENRNVTKYIKALGFKINDDSCPISYSNTKVNFASCEQVNNMCNAIWYQRYNPYPSLTARDTMEFAMGVQFIKDAGNIPDAQHFVLFGDDKYHMYSIANMGTSKKNVHVFHDLSNENEVCIEVNDNDKYQELMISDDLSEEDWSGDYFYGMRYPDTKNPSQEIRDAWQRLVSWMAASNPNAATGETLETPEIYGNYTFRGHDRNGLQVLKGTTITQYAGRYTRDTFERRMAKMLSECEDYMVMDSFLYHYVYLERHTMQDNVSKNNFWSSTDLIHWDLSKAYDMDTSDGNNNQGKLVFDYGLEWNDIDPTDRDKMTFNGNQSVWFVFVANLYEACQTMFTNREAAGAWSAQAYHNYFLSEQRKVPERCWIQTYWYDYLRTYEDDINGEWMSFLDGGQKTHQRKHYETFEELYDSSKYRGSASTSRTINLRAYTPPQWGGVVTAASGAVLRSKADASASIVTTIPNGQIIYITEKTNDLWRKVTYGSYEGYLQISQVDAVEPKGELTITMYNKMYISVDVGTTSLTPIKADRGIPYVINFDDGGIISNTVIAINTASMVQAVSGFEQLYPDTCVFGEATRLRELTIGSSAKGYVNQNLRSLSLSNNRMLERLFVQNQPNVSTVLDLTNCPALVYLDATGSGFTGYEFADGGLLETAILESPVSLSIRNPANLTDEGLIINDYSKLISLRIENAPEINTLAIVQNATSLQIARLLGIYWMLENVNVLTRLYGLQGYDENGITTSRSVLAGYAHSPTIRQRNYDEFTAAWPNLEIDLNNTTIIEEYPIHFLNADGEALLGRNGYPYVQYVGRGEDAYDPVAAGELDEPTKPMDEQYIYTYSGWDQLPISVLGESNVTAQYTTEEREYTVQWYLDSSENTLLKSITATFGTELLYDAENENNFPIKTSEENLYVYNVFTGWDKSTGYIRENLKVHGLWERASLPNPGTKELDEMNVAEIYSVAKSQRANQYWTPKDYVDIRMGRDFNFSNVTSQTLLENQYFDGTKITRSDIQLFSEDAPSFTLVIDYEYTDITSDAVLAACYDANGAEGFMLQYYYTSSASHGINLVWGDKTTTIAHGTNRGIISIRHRKGSASLYICSDNGGRSIYHNNADNSETTSGYYRYDGYNTNMLTVEVPRTQATKTTAVLSFGGLAVGTQGSRNLAKGWIHWAKIWYDDLGNTAVKQLAYWPHEIWRMHYRGSGLYNIVNETGLPDGASFISNAALPQFYELYDLTTNSSNNFTEGGWPESALRKFMNDRCYKAFPVAWLSIIQTAQLQTRSGGSDTATLEISSDNVYIPARADLIAVTDALYVSEGKQIEWIVDNPTRAKFMGLIVPQDAAYYTDLDDDPTLYTDSYRVKEGDVWLNTSTNRVYIYVSAETASKHYSLGGRYTSNEINLAASGTQGGLWVCAYGYLTRSPRSNIYQYGINANGNVTTRWMGYNEYTRTAIVPMISI